MKSSYKEEFLEEEKTLAFPISNKNSMSTAKSSLGHHFSDIAASLDFNNQ